MRNSYYDVAIIGAGASGLMLAANLDIGCSSGVVLEGTSCIGKKLLMSGGGRCNITHGGSIKDFVSAYGEAGPVLRKCLYKHNNLELISWLESRGVETTDEGGRIFPTSMKAKDVLNAFVSEAASNKWKIKTGAKVCGFGKNSDGVWIIELKGADRLKDKEQIVAKSVVVATGGITYPESGSDGSMLELLKGMGLRIKEPRPALAPIYVKHYPYAELSGISVSDVSVTIFDRACVSETVNSEAGTNKTVIGMTDAERDTKAEAKGKSKSVSMRGDLLFTHECLSGPVILNISKYAEEGDLISIRYNKSLEDLPRRMQRILQDRARGESGDIKTKVLEGLLNKDEFIVKGVSERGMVTSGGVLLDELDMSSMRCKSDETLFIIGEALDADGITGGYNLQMCWSTACTCADALRGILTNSY